jgi:hypothetical protein
LKKKFGIKVSGCCEIVITSHWLHELCDEYMLAVLGELLLIPGQVRVAVGLDQGTTCHGTVFCGASVPTTAAAAAFFFQIEGGGLHRRLAGVAGLVNMTLPWPKLLKEAGERTAFILPEMMGVVCCMPLREVIGGAIDLSDTGWRPTTLLGRGRPRPG